MSAETFLDGRVTLHPGDARDVVAALAPGLIDACVTDPPYALVSIGRRFGKPGAAAPRSEGATGVYTRAAAGFMGQSWDTGETAFDPAFWAGVLQALKPGAHLVAFGGSRSYHRLACAIEDAGFEIRDQIGWLYGSGFPKSHDVAKAIDKAAGVAGEVIGTKAVSRRFDGSDLVGGTVRAGMIPLTAPVSAAALEWQGWGTALKPAWEPIVLARKPLNGTVAATVLEHGTGALNIAGCRIEAERSVGWGGKAAGGGTWNEANSGLAKDGAARPVEGRWPANIVHDGSDEVIGCFPEAPGAVRGVGPEYGAKAAVNTYGDWGPRGPMSPRGDSGSAARFFYSAKADSGDRLGSKHPTVKPVDLMQWLVRLVTPKGGLVLDPFAGTGTTGEAAFREGVRATLIEREADYQADIRRRMALVLAGPDERARAILKAKHADSTDAGPLFAGVAP